MTRLIINNHSDLDEWHALDLVRRVVEMGRISNNHLFYCYATTFRAGNAKYAVTALRTKAGTDVFHIYAEEMEG